MYQATGRIRAKVCGITRSQDVIAAVQTGVDAIGLVFFPPSPRYVAIDQARQLIRHVPPYVQIVGLFVNADVDQIAEVLTQLPIDILQFHGDETPEDCQKIAQKFQRRWYKAIQVRAGLDVMAQIQHYQKAGASAILLDAWHPQLKGGTGQAFDWSQFPESDMPLILAGGLTPENIEYAISITKPYAVDVSGGVESAKGIKDQQLIQHFMQGVQRGSTN
ncbi:phosphoribosylanthranilate isomerase [Acinetobacter qingfengensis]|uniref:N-(5'-phosphoribosyl)anthranilate isomerase n=1 Tax=Acinetobacter qingfengensis TaxID=1262585 RepID=A0A1E7QXD6_9GAMM|nr:phosphoribosylanthranilate isomerase [Acinetobacter qingfengensis]KAA8731645.1 phosphoribosylanthranilate isomerase [Acinetobacter qingfengensis]OEY91748.1 N-(5'-phosphoribosyl)anthranilate isomerase [Acinetobacter qingfengensis]